MSRLLFSGFYGMGNAGDEAVLAALVQTCRECQPEVAITVLSGDPSATARDHGVAAVPRRQPRGVLQALRGSDVFVSGGGSLLQDATSAQSLLYYLGLILLARLARRPVVVLAQGIGPIRRTALRRMTGRVLSGVARITVRDPDSAAELERLGVTRDGRSPVEVTADPVFALAPAPAARGWEILAGVGLTPGPVASAPNAPIMEGVRIASSPTPPITGGSGRRSAPLVGISVRPWPGIDDLLPPLAEGLREALTACGGRAILLPLQPESDTPVCRRLAEQIEGAAVLAARPSPAEWLALIGCLDLTVAMRLHALIFSATAGVPLIGISYDPKIDSLLARLDRPPAGRVDSLDPAALASRVRGALADPASERAPEAVIASLRAAARRNAEVALSVR